MKDAQIFALDPQGSLQAVKINVEGGLDVSVSGFTSSVAAVGTTVADAADDGSAPIKVGGIARIANPTAVSAGDRVAATFDDVGRQVMALYQLRDLIATAWAQTVTAAEVTLLAGVSGVFHDLIEVSCSNTTASARTVEIRDTAGSGPLVSITVPATSAVTQQFPATKPQNEAGNAWTIANVTPGLIDDSNDNIIVSATFIKNV